MGPGFSPLDEELGLLPGSVTPTLQAEVVRLGTSLGFAEAGEIFTRFTKIPMSAATVRRLTEATGQAAVARVAREAAAHLGPGVVLEPTGPPPALLQLSVDGCMVPTRTGWREVKLLTIGAVRARPASDAGPRAIELSYFGRLATAERFADLAVVETARRRVAEAAQVVAVVDGSDWCQGFVDRHRPDAVRILDFPHGAQRLSPVAEAIWGEGSAARAWGDQQRHRLRHESPERVLGALRALPVRHAPDPAAARRLRDETLGYLGSRREQLRYADFVAQGWPIGSGAVESGHRHVVEARLKGAGRRWAEANVDAMVELRTTVANDRWEETWQQAARDRLAAARARTAARRQGRRAVAGTPVPAVPASRPRPAPTPAIPVLPRPGPKTIVNGRPTAAHPWKRFTRRPPPAIPKL